MRLMSGAALVLAASLIAAPQASAQLSPHIVVALGAAVPTGDFGNFAKMGYNVSGGLALSAPLVPIGVRVEGMYNAFDGKGIAAGTTTKISAGTVNATFGGAMLPMVYAIGGVGIYHFDPAGSENNKFGFNIGAGLKIPLTGFGAHVEARYHHVTVNGGSFSFIPVTFGVTF
jgi:hypothetical protein